MLNQQEIGKLVSHGREISTARSGDTALGPLSQLPGNWGNSGNLVGHGWNLIALPFRQPGSPLSPSPAPESTDFRLLLNQFDETLAFTKVDKAVPNRGAATKNLFDRDQHLAALQYIQNINQVAAVDEPVTSDAPDTPKGPKTIHHEPGLLLHMFSQTDGGPDIARLGTIPHGDAVLALGNGVVSDGPPNFDQAGDFSGLPVGVNPDVDKNPYLLPYKKFRDAPFKGLFNPVDPLALLKSTAEGMKIKRTTTLTFDTTLATGGISNIPFVTRQANATSMRVIFWIEELDEANSMGQPRIVLQYAQKILLAFFPIGSEKIGIIQWPHISINTMELLATSSDAVKA